MPWASRSLARSPARWRKASRSSYGPLVGLGRFLRQPPVVDRLLRPGADVLVAGARVVDLDPVPALAPEELVDGLVRRLAPEVPEGDIERRVAAHLDAAGAVADVAVEAPEVVVDPQRVLAEQVGGDRFVDVGLHGPRPEEGFPKADRPLVGVDPQPEQVRELLQPQRLDPGNLHACPLYPRAVGPLPQDRRAGTATARTPPSPGGHRRTENAAPISIAPPTCRPELEGAGRGAGPRAWPGPQTRTAPRSAYSANCASRSITASMFAAVTRSAPMM
jgi:hypothetical protein